MRIAGLEVKSTKEVFNEDTRIAACVMAKVKEGKTTLAATLDKLTRKHHGKPTLFVTCEKSSGAGLETLRQLDIPYVTPDSLEELEKLLAELQGSEDFMGVVGDSFHEIYNHAIKPQILKTPPREKSSFALEARKLGVLTDSDYNKSAEIVRRVINSFLALTKLGAKSKHVVFTINERNVLDEDRRTVLRIMPDLPGQSRDTMAGMVPIIGRLKLTRRVAKDQSGKAVANIVRTFDTTSGGEYATCDRLGVLENEVPADFCEMYEKYWLPKVGKKGASE